MPVLLFQKALVRSITFSERSGSLSPGPSSSPSGEDAAMLWVTPCAPSRGTGPGLQRTSSEMGNFWIRSPKSEWNRPWVLICQCFCVLFYEKVIYDEGRWGRGLQSRETRWFWNVLGARRGGESLQTWGEGGCRPPHGQEAPLGTEGLFQRGLEERPWSSVPHSSGLPTSGSSRWVRSPSYLLSGLQANPNLWFGWLALSSNGFVSPGWICLYELSGIAELFKRILFSSIMSCSGHIFQGPKGELYTSGEPRLRNMQKMLTAS